MPARSSQIGNIKTKTDADTALDELKNAVRAGAFDKRGIDPPREVSPQTFREFAQVYKERHVLAKRLALARSIDYCLKPIIEHFGDRPLESIRTADIEDFIADLRKPRIVKRRKGPADAGTGIDQPDDRADAAHADPGC